MAIRDFTQAPLDEIVSLKGRRAVVTGGARGIGAGIVRRLAEAGASVVIGDINSAGAADVARKTWCPAGAKIEALPLDVTSEASIDHFATAATQKLGGLDIWVNNAGFYPRGPAIDMAVEAWDTVQTVNLRGTFLCSREAAKHMHACQSEHAVIVNIASMSGLRGRTNMSHYISAKHGVVGLTKAMGLEFGPMNIRVLGIAPALIVPDEELNSARAEKAKQEFPLGRAGVPDDIARVALFCASDLSAFMTGSTLMLDAGSGAGVFP